MFYFKLFCVILVVVLRDYCHLLCSYLCQVCIAVFTLDAGLLARSQYSEGPATGHLDTGFPWFRHVFKQIMRWFPKFQVATTCLSGSPPDLNLLVTNFMFCIHVKLPLLPGDKPTAVIIIIIISAARPNTLAPLLLIPPHRSLGW